MILTWNFKAYEPGYYDYIHASVPCQFYSLANRGKRNLDTADAIAKRTLEVLDYLNPRFWSLENPHSSLIWKGVYRDLIPKHTLDYCKYALWGYRKRTVIATNMFVFEYHKQFQSCTKMYLESTDRRHQAVPIQPVVPFTRLFLDLVSSYHEILEIQVITKQLNI